MEQCLDLFLDELLGLVLDLVAAVVSHHVTLVWQIQLFLVADHCPALLDEDWHAVHGHVLLLSVRKEQSVFVVNVESSPDLLALIKELLLFEDFVGNHCKVKLEELIRRRVFKFIRLVDLTPDPSNVAFQNNFDPLPIISSVVKVSKDKQQPLCCLLIKQLQIDLENDLEQPVV